MEETHGGNAASVAIEASVVRALASMHAYASAIMRLEASRLLSYNKRLASAGPTKTSQHRLALVF